MAQLTPIEKHGDVFFKRDDLYTYEGLCGAKVRGAVHLINAGLERGFTKFTTVGHRKSPQIHIVGTICKSLGLQFVGHTPEGELPDAFKEFTIQQHRAGYNNVIAARCHKFAVENKFYEIPFGMERDDVVNLTMQQVDKLPDCKRVVVPVGSGVNLSGILRAFRRLKIRVPVLGIVVGRSPVKTLEKYAPFGWRAMVELREAGVDYAKPAKETVFNGITLDPIYEAKCIPFIEKGDLFWIIGKRTF